MLAVKDVYRLQTEYSVSDASFKGAEVTFEDYVTQCRKFLADNMTEEYILGDWDAQKKQDFVVDSASRFVDLHKVRVRGYVSSEGIMNNELLLSDVIDSVTGIGILQEAINDPDIDEIQINDKDTIFVSKGGTLQPYVDKHGRILRFINDQEIRVTLSRMIDDGTGTAPQFTDGNPVLNEKTAKEQYRISAVHPVVNTSDKPPFNFEITSVVIRKFKETKLTIEDLIANGAITEKMGRLLKLFGKADLKLFCVGPTASGKTTLLNIIGNEIPLSKRILLIQNPTEISFMERDEHGRRIRNVVHWEVTKFVDQAALISNSLRFSPEIIFIGEARTGDEFSQTYRVARTGHPVYGTFHAYDGYDAVNRFADEISSVGGMSSTEAVGLVADTLDIVITQFRFSNGRRRVMAISEICGTDDKGKPVINNIFEFKLSGKTKDMGNGLVETLGTFKQTGVISPRLKDMLYRASIDNSLLEEFLDEDDIEAPQGVSA